MSDSAVTYTDQHEQLAQRIPLRVVSWNMNHWQRTLDQRERAWTYLANGMGADVALLQETVPSASVARDRVLYHEIAGYRPWGSAIVALSDRVKIEEIWSVRTPYSRRRFTLANTNPGSVVVGRLTVDGVQPITLVSIYNVIDTYAQTNMLRIVADLIPLFDSGDGARVILGGDLNMSTADSVTIKERIPGIFAAVKGLGLTDISDLDLSSRPAHLSDCHCGRGDDCRHFNTWGHAQLDYVLATPSLAGQVTALEARSGLEDLSDHLPVLVSMELDPTPVPRAWDKDQFTAEIARRNGDWAGEIVNRLVDHAEKKEISLRDAGRRDVGLTRFPTSVSANPEMWWQIDYPPERPKHLQYSFSVRAKGDVVIQFRWIVQQPFRRPEDRVWIAEALGNVGVQLSKERLNGFPTFPLSALRDPRALAGLLAIYDRLVDETQWPPLEEATPSVAAVPQESPEQ